MRRFLTTALFLIGLTAAFPALAWNVPGFDSFSTAEPEPSPTSQNLEYERTHLSEPPAAKHHAAKHHAAKHRAKGHGHRHGKKHHVRHKKG